MDGAAATTACIPSGPGETLRCPGQLCPINRVSSGWQPTSGAQVSICTARSLPANTASCTAQVLRFCLGVEKHLFAAAMVTASQHGATLPQTGMARHFLLGFSRSRHKHPGETHLRTQRRRWILQFGLTTEALPHVPPSSLAWIIAMDSALLLPVSAALVSSTCGIQSKSDPDHVPPLLRNVNAPPPGCSKSQRVPQKPAWTRPLHLGPHPLLSPPSSSATPACSPTCQGTPASGPLHCSALCLAHSPQKHMWLMPHFPIGLCYSLYLKHQHPTHPQLSLTLFLLSVTFPLNTLNIVCIYLSWYLFCPIKI